MSCRCVPTITPAGTIEPCDCACPCHKPAPKLARHNCLRCGKAFETADASDWFCNRECRRASRAAVGKQSESGFNSEENRAWRERLRQRRVPKQRKATRAEKALEARGV